MPKGIYSLREAGGDVVAYERFACAPGPEGWRYAAEVRDASGAARIGTVDVTVDRLWRPVRVEVGGGGWVVRGGQAGTALMWVRTGPTGAGAHEGSARAAAFSGRSPAFSVVTARLLGLSVGGVADVRLVTLAEPVLAPRTADERWRLVEVTSHETTTGPLPVEHLEAVDLETGESRRIHLAGDVVLAAPGVELEELESPPTT
ncbi:MAG: hypothetical protein ACRDPK_06440 [Carbonactinosporaceae bacterium]